MRIINFSWVGVHGTRRKGDGVVRLGAICKEYVGHSGGKVQERYSNAVE